MMDRWHLQEDTAQARGNQTVVLAVMELVRPRMTGQWHLQDDAAQEGGSQTVMLAVATDEEMGISMQPDAANTAEEDDVARPEVCIFTAFVVLSKGLSAS